MRKTGHTLSKFNLKGQAKLRTIEYAIQQSHVDPQQLHDRFIHEENKWPTKCIPKKGLPALGVFNDP